MSTFFNVLIQLSAVTVDKQCYCFCYLLTVNSTLSSQLTSKVLYSVLTTLLCVHNHSVKATSLQQVTCLTLLDSSAAFDTIDHSISLERLSFWFGITSNAPSVIKSYLLNRSFSVHIEVFKSCACQLLYGVPQGSVLGPLRFILYTTPLRKVISDSSSSHKLHADDTQLNISFSANDFSHNMAPLRKVQPSFPSSDRWLFDQAVTA